MDKIVIEQSDRDAAAERLAVAGLGLTLNDPRNHTATRIRSGDYDHHPWVQAFAAHRLAERERAAKVADERASAYANILAVNLLNAARQGEAQRIAAAIRAGDEK